MKINLLFIGFLALFFVPFASALTIEITGSTAFRAATISAIHKLYTDSGQGFRFSHNGLNESDFTSADVITFEGRVNFINSTTVIRCSFNGSFEGLRAMAEPGQTGITGYNGDARYLKLSTAQTETAIVGGRNIENIDIGDFPFYVNGERATAEMALSDVDKAISPYAANDMVGASPGVVVFGLVVSEGANAITNVTAAQYNSLLTNGYVKMSQFTGNSADDTRLVFCTGFNDGSGTRAAYLTEMGFGASNPVQQFLVVSQNGNQIKAIQKVPVNGTNDSSPAAGIQLPSGSDIKAFDDGPETITQLSTSLSTVWGQNVAGNGGAFSGSVLRGHLALDGDSVTVFEADGFDFLGAPATNIGLVSWMGIDDAVRARAGGATFASFNGVSLAVSDNSGRVLTTADRNKIYNGQYTAWNFAQFYRRFTADADTLTLYNAIFATIPNNLGWASLLRNVDMKIGRYADGGVITPVF